MKHIFANHHRKILNQHLFDFFAIDWQYDLLIEVIKLLLISL